MRVLVVDENVVFLRAVKRILRQQPAVARVGCAATVEKAMALMRSLKPHLVLLDSRMRSATGVDLARSFKNGPGSPWVAVLTLFDGPEYRAAAAAAGADGALSKSQFTAQLPSLLQTCGSERP